MFPSMVSCIGLMYRLSYSIRLQLFTVDEHHYILQSPNSSKESSEEHQANQIQTCIVHYYQDYHTYIPFLLCLEKYLIDIRHNN